MKQFRNPSDVHQPVGSYSHQIEVSDERILIISGQVGMGQDGMIPTEPYEQLDLAFENIFRNLRAANMDVSDLIKITYYLVGEWDTTKRREIVVSKLQGHQPCSTLLFVAALASPQFRVEIEAWASHSE